MHVITMLYPPTNTVGVLEMKDGQDMQLKWKKFGINSKWCRKRQMRNHEVDWNVDRKMLSK